MSFQITANTAITVTASPGIGFGESYAVEAVDRVSFVMAPGSRQIAIQPGNQPGDVKFLAVLSTRYDTRLSYVVDGGTNAVLDGPHMFCGNGAVALIGETPNTFEFTNAIVPSASPTITMLIGRNAGP
jgi:hypothetical protein